MEFIDLGAHCQYEGCNQKDFLPFKCDTCAKSLCLLHRSYAAHECHGAKAKDMTSIDCPVCGKGVKFDKAQDPNIVWDHHYLHECTQKAPVQQKVVVRCFKPGCSTILGPSNKFTCNKCHMNVCLAHRIPEEHSCVGPIRKDFLEKVQKNMKVGNADPPTKKRHETQHVGIFHHCDKDDKEKAKKGHQEKRPHTSNAPSSATVHQKAAAVISCPFCGLPHESEAVLADHILAFHSEDSLPPAVVPVGSGSHHTTSSSSASQQAPTGASALHREVCPLCHMRFPDAISLVRHFEASHSERSQDVRSAAGTTSSAHSGNNHNSSGSTNHCNLS